MLYVSWGRAFAVCMTFAYLAVSTARYVYWIDGSCSDKRKLRTAIHEAFAIAKRAAERLEDPSDIDFANVYKTLFHVKKSDTTRMVTNTMKQLLGLPNPQKRVIDHVADVVESMGWDWIEGGYQNSSDVRIYCDQDRRWTEDIWTHGTEISPSGYLLWSDGDEIWFDEANQMARPLFLEPECRLSPGNGAAGVTNRMPIPRIEEQNEDRSVITLCDNSFEKRSYMTIGELLFLIRRAKLDMINFRQGIKSFDLSLTFIVLHEFLHTRHYLLNDISVDGNSPYLWQNIITYDPYVAVNNVNNYVYLCVFAALADRNDLAPGWTLIRPEDDPTGWNRHKGLLKRYRDLPLNTDS